MRRLSLLACMLAGGSVPALARAADKPLYQPAPAWVAPAPAIDATKLTDESPVIVRLDHQDRLENGVVWSYSDVATRMASPEIVKQSGTINIAWQPDKGDLVIHKLEIIRGGQHIDLLAGGKTLEVIRREQRLEQQQLDGMLSATMAVAGLSVGDVLHIVASVTEKETPLQNRMHAAIPLAAPPLSASYVRTRLLWPQSEAVAWRSYADGAAPKVTAAGDFHEVTLTGLLPKPADLPNDAPVRFQKLPVLEASTFSGWADVSKVNAPLYATDGLIAPDSALAKEVAAIAAANSDPLKRAAAALQLVQDKVRYLYNGLSNGNYVPQTPAQTWTLRYGDCKAKTLLLLAMLKSLGIEAEPVLASVTLGDLLPDRLPSAGAFDHVFVRATIKGETFWLDGTGSAARYSDIRDTPPMKWVLPVRAAGSGLLQVPPRAPADSSGRVQLDIDQTAGLRLPALVHAVVTVRGPAAEMLGLVKTQGSKDQKDQMVQNAMQKILNTDYAAVSSYTLTYDPAEAVSTIDATAVMSTSWYRQDDRYRMQLDRTVSQLNFSPDRARPAWQKIPVATGLPDASDIVMRVHLPKGSTGFTLDGDTALNDTLGGAAIRRSTRIDGDTIVIEEHDSSTGAEIAPDQVAAAKARVALAKTRLAQVIAPDTLPQRWQTAEAGRKDGRFKPILDSYAKAIANDPEEASGYTNRAAFLTGVYEYKEALPDYGKAISLDPSADLYMQRAVAYRQIGDDAHAIADAQAALKLDPTSQDAIGMLGEYEVDKGQRDAAIARVEQRIEAGGDDKAAMQAIKADLLVRAGDPPAAIATLDQAIQVKPGSPSLLNQRCWAKGRLNTALDTALKDCTKAIELSDSPTAALDSRALVYLRMNRLDDALADLNAALENNPDAVGSLYLRGIVRTRMGQVAAARDDLAAARLMNPIMPAEYKRFGVAP